MKVLFLSVTVGAGHNVVANNIKSYFEKNGHQTYLIDIFEKNKNIQHTISGYGFKAMYKLPKIANYFYYRCKTSNHTYFEKIINFAKERVIRLINDFQPDIIVSSHIAGLLITQKFRKEINKPFKNCFFVTDYDNTPSLFNDDNKDYIIVPNDDFRNELLERGFSKERVFAFGIPINEVFFEKKDKNEIIKKHFCNFDTSKKTILFMGGGKGLGNIYKNIKYIDKNSNHQIIVVCGKNKKLKNRIDKLKSSKIFSFGFVNFVDELMEVSDFIFGKTGGLSSTEALAKNLSIISFDNIPCPEQANLKYFVSKNVAIEIKRRKEFLLSLEKNYIIDNSDIIKQNTAQNVYNLLVKDNKDE